MKISRLLALPLLLSSLLSMQPCHADWWFLPTKRDMSIFFVATAVTAASLRNYYFGHEERIRNEVRQGNEELRNQFAQAAATQEEQVQQLRRELIEQETRTRETIEHGAEYVGDRIENAELQLRTQLSDLLALARNSQALLLEQAQRQEALPSSTAQAQLTQSTSASSRPSSRPMALATMQASFSGRAPSIVRDTVIKYPAPQPRGKNYPM